jgi:hypothetical protein
MHGKINKIVKIIIEIITIIIMNIYWLLFKRMLSEVIPELKKLLYVIKILFTFSIYSIVIFKPTNFIKFYGFKN